MEKYRKAIVAGIGGLLTVLVSLGYLTDAQALEAEQGAQAIIQGVIAVAIAIGVYQVPND